MTKYWPALVLLCCVAGLTGCGGSAPTPTEVEVPKEPEAPTPTNLTEDIDVVLADLLAKPRAELAVQADELAQQIHLQHKARAEGRLDFPLLRDLHLPLAVPVLRVATYSAQQGLSLPPYLKEGAKDTDLALHLARHGDVEAALKLADPADGKEKIEALRAGRNYPVEWTRLVGLMQHAAALKLATGEAHGAVELIALHRQLTKVLDAKAAAGPLGAQLLGTGRQVLAQAAEAWKQVGRDNEAEQVSEVLAQWGAVPLPTLALRPGQPAAEAARLLRGQLQGLAVVAESPGRAIDLLALPLPDANAQAVFALTDGRDEPKVAELLVLYARPVLDTHPEPHHLAYRLEEAGLFGQAIPTTAGAKRRTYKVGDLSGEVLTLPKTGRLIGGAVRLALAKPPAEGAVLPRDFGPIHLDRSFEQVRQRVAVDQLADAVHSEKPAVLSATLNLLPNLKPKKVVVRRQPNQEAIAGWVLEYEPSEIAHLSELALPLWLSYGPGRFEGVEDDLGAGLALVWEDALTRLELRLPSRDEDGARLALRSNAPERAPRDAAAALFDRTEREQRLKENKPLTRLPRFVDVPWALQTRAVRLGMTREQVAAAVPQDAKVVQRPIPGGVSVVFWGEPGKQLERPYSVAHLIVRFDDAGKAVELRSLYRGGPGADLLGTKWVKDLTADLRKAGGAPLTMAGPWQAAWTDLPAVPGPSATISLWRDDLTLLTCQSDASAAEVMLRDCPAEHPRGVPLPPLAYLPRGVEEVHLGDKVTAVLARWKIEAPVKASDGALVLAPPKSSNYELILVYGEKDEVVRLVGRHRQQAGKPATTLNQPLLEAWAAERLDLGWPQRREFAGNDNKTLNSLGWADNQTRVRLFWSDTRDSGPRLHTEWRALPLPVPAPKP